MLSEFVAFNADQHGSVTAGERRRGPGEPAGTRTGTKRILAHGTFRGPQIEIKPGSFCSGGKGSGAVNETFGRRYVSGDGAETAKLEQRNLRRSALSTCRRTGS